MQIAKEAAQKKLLWLQSNWKPESGIVCKAVAQKSTLQRAQVPRHSNYTVAGPLEKIETERNV